MVEMTKLFYPDIHLNELFDNIKQSNIRIFEIQSLHNIKLVYSKT